MYFSAMFLFVTRHQYSWWPEWSIKFTLISPGFSLCMKSYIDLRIRWRHLSTVHGTAPHCLVSTGGDVNFLETRNLVYKLSGVEWKLRAERVVHGDEYFGRPFAVRCIGQRIFLCTICALENLCTNRQPNIFAQAIDKYFGRQFAVRLCTNDWRIFRTSICCPFVHKRLANISDVHLLSVCAQTVGRYIGTKRKRKFNENQEITL